MTITTVTVSVIIPVLNEERNVGAVLENILRMCPSVELIIVDGGSTDRTREISESFPVKIIRSAKGRGVQLNAGAAAATSDLLVFLHADTRLPHGAFQQMETLFASAQIDVARFRLKFDTAHWLLNLYSIFTRVDSLWTSFGDQCLIVRRSFFLEFGPFPEWPLFEDVHFLRKARTITKINILPAWVITSSRRFVENGILRQQIINASLISRYLLGESPESLAKRYEQKMRKQNE